MKKKAGIGELILQAVEAHEEALRARYYFVRKPADDGRSNWKAMIRRCTVRHSPDFKHYGALGISVCPRWMSFKNFIADMGPKPAGSSIERIHVRHGYEPANCRWATPKEQARNRRNTRRFGGETLKEITERHGVNYWTAWSRIRRGCDPMKSATTIGRVAVEK